MSSCSYIERNDGDLHQPRSRSNSHLSTTTSQFEHLRLKSTTPTNQEEGTYKEEPPASSFLSSDPLPLTSNDNNNHSTINLITPTPQHTTPFPDFSQEDLDAKWSYLGASENSTVPTPLLNLESVPSLPRDNSLGSQPSLSRSNSFPMNMSAIGIQQPYDSRFDATVNQSMTWPRFDMNDQFLSTQQMSPPMPNSTLNPYENSMPMYARSISSSPPRGSLTPEQRELKRQRDLSRRDSKVQMRRDRSTSNPYSLSPRPSPEMMSRSLSEFSNNNLGHPSPLMSQSSQGSPNLSNLGSPSPAYLSQYTPGMDAGADMYGGGLFAMGPNEFAGLPAYNMPFSTEPMQTTLPSYIPRQHSHSLSSNDMPNMQSMHSLYGHPSPKMSHDADGVRVVQSRPKPQCWEHGCNGRQFSTFSNLLRHQREKSGAATKSSCPNCGAEFTRTTARNGHMAHEKCKQRRST